MHKSLFYNMVCCGIECIGVFLCLSKSAFAPAAPFFSANEGIGVIVYRPLD